MTERPLRINVIGTSGSGKSTICLELSRVLEIPYIEMDQIFWGPNWTMPFDSQFFENLRASLGQPAWVLDGNYTRTIPIKWERVQMVIWLDYSFARTLLQAIRRAIKRTWSGHELWEGTGNRESFRRSFLSKDSIIWWTIKTHAQVRARCEAHLSKPSYAHIKFVRLRSPAEAQALLGEFRSQK